MRIGKGNVLAIEINSPAGVRDARGAGAAPLIELRDVVFSYAGHMVVDGVSLQVNRGELVALLGPNGCGKTTIMRLINGLEVPSTGTYLFDGEMVDAAYLADPVRSQRFHQRVGFVFQNADAQLFCATVGEEVAFGPAQMGQTSSSAASAMPWNCSRLPIWSMPRLISFRAGKRSVLRWLPSFL